MLESSFDDELDDIIKVIQEATQEVDQSNEAVLLKTKRTLIECRDPNDNSPLGEAAAGGAVKVIKFLIENGANPNHRGQWGRTPLYRAAFAGSSAAVQLLLESGADPEISADDHNVPKEASGQKSVTDLIESWDVEKTKELIKKFNSSMNLYKESQRKQLANEMGSIEEEVEEKKRLFEIAKKQLATAYCEYEKRITEHDEAMLNNFEKPELLVRAINDAELTLETCKIKQEETQLALSQAMLKFREQEHRQRCFDNQEDEEFDEDAILSNPLIQRSNFKEIDEVIIKDVGNKIKDSQKWPLIIDISGRVNLFFKYRDTNMVNILDIEACKPQRLKESLLGAIRYGKPLIIDVGPMDLWTAMESSFERIMPGLWAMLISQTLMENQNYMKLVDEKVDKPEYHHNKFVHINADKFKFMVTTKMSIPPDSWIDNLYAIEIVHQDSN